MKVTILKPITHAGKVWNVGDTPSVTSELARRLRANGFIADDAAEAAPADEAPKDDAPKEADTPDEIKPRPTRKPRKSRK